MRVYLAAMMYNDFREGSGLYSRLEPREQQAVREVQHILDSYHYVGNARLVNRIREAKKRIFLDSGAFSAYTQGVEMDLPKYCRYILDNADLIEELEDGVILASVLDAIGKPAEETWRNQDRMEREFGVRPLPCFHYGEPFEVLQYYVANYSYITIGGMVPISSAQLEIWLDQIWGNYLTNEDGSAKVRVHGFGMTSVPLMERYPWFSVDSSSWVQLGGMGNIFIPQFGTIAISEKAPQRKEAGKHVDNLPDPQRRAVVGFIEGLGFDLDRLRRLHLTRKVFNMVTYSSFVADSSAKRFIQPQPLLF